MQRMHRQLAMVLVAAACGGKQPHASNDSGTDADPSAANDAAIDTMTSVDATSDAPIDGLMGVLSPEPPDPVAVSCAGRLGFPTRPVLKLVDPYSGANTLDVGDFTGDGKADIAATTSGYLQVATGTAIGTFDTPTTVATGLSNMVVRLADINGDGKLDLVYGDRLAKNIYVRLNNGIGAFGAATAYDATINVDQVDARDLNNDGRTDLIAFSHGYPQLSVLLNSATGFGTAATYVVSSSNVMYFALSDVSGDGRPDALVSELLGNVTVTLNNGAGAFGLPTSFTGGGGQGGMITAGDLNGDGKRDIIVAGASTQAGYVSVLVNQGSNTFATHVDYATGSSYPGRALAVGDANGDGRLDVVVGSLGGDSDIQLFLGNGNGTLAAPIALAPDHPGDIVLRDIDANGSLDLITAGAGTLRTYLNQGTTMPFDQRSMFAYADQVPDARTLDVNGDSTPDLIAMTYSSAGNTVTTRLGTSGTFAGTATAAATLAFYPWSTYATDLDNDARRDLVVLGGAPLAQVVMSSGNGTLAALTPFGVSYAPRGIAAADFDGDGFRDLAIGATDGTVRLYHGNGNGSVTAPTTVWTGTGLMGVGYGDVDKDGHRDLLVSSSNGPTNVIDVAHGNGNGTFASPIPIALAHTAPVGLLVRDFNADGNPDILEYGNGWFGVHLGNGNGTFAAAMPQLVGSSKDAAIADFDGDGKLDVVTLDFRSPSIILMRGHGDGTFDPPLYFDAGNGATSLSVMDVNADGRLDVVLNNAQAVSVLWGRCL